MERKILNKSGVLVLSVDYDDEDPSTYNGIEIRDNKGATDKIFTGDFDADIKTVQEKYKQYYIICSSSHNHFLSDREKRENKPKEKEVLEKEIESKLGNLFLNIDWDEEDPSTYNGIEIHDDKGLADKIFTGDFDADIKTVENKYQPYHIQCGSSYTHFLMDSNRRGFQ